MVRGTYVLIGDIKFVLKLTNFIIRKTNENLEEFIAIIIMNINECLFKMPSKQSVTKK